MRTCLKCAREYPDHVRFCIEDGTALEVTAERAVATVHGRSGRRISKTEAAATLPDHDSLDGVARPSDDGLLAPGTEVGEYVIERRIGEGGMGIIFAGTHPIIGKRVAIKVLNSQMAMSAEVVGRFVQEAKSVNQIRHRNIVDIFSFGMLPDGRHYFTMELLEGESLAQRLAKSTLGWHEAVDVWLQVSSAIEAAHSHSIIHRDLKPDNVFLSPAPEGVFVKVLDFGIAKLQGSTALGPTATSEGMPIGTPTYMSPEQAAGRPVDHRADLYAFGVMMFEMISGRTPFRAKTVIELMSAHINEPPPPLESVVEDVHPKLAALVNACLAKEPEDRPRGMRELRQCFDELRHEAIAQRRPLYGKAMPVERARERRRLSWPILVAGALALAAASGVAIWRRPSPVVAPAPPTAPAAAPVAAPALVAPPAPTNGRLVITTNTAAARVYLDRSPEERSAEPVAAGGGTLRVTLTPDVTWSVRIESPGYKTKILPARLASGEESAIPVVLEREPSHSRGKKEAPTVPPSAPRPAPPPKAGDESFLDPFNK